MCSVQEYFKAAFGEKVLMISYLDLRKHLVIAYGCDIGPDGDEGYCRWVVGGYFGCGGGRPNEGMAGLMRQPLVDGAGWAGVGRCGAGRGIRGGVRDGLAGAWRAGQGEAVGRAVAYVGWQRWRMVVRQLQHSAVACQDGWVRRGRW